MKLWIDDLRPPPDSVPSEFNPGETMSPSWWWAKNSKAAIDTLSYHNHSPVWEPFEEISFDHDLGGDDTSRPVVMWMCEHAEKIIWPKVIHVHSQNPVGVDWLVKMFERYAPDGTVIRRTPAPRG